MRYSFWRGLGVLLTSLFTGGVWGWLVFFICAMVIPEQILFGSQPYSIRASLPYWFCGLSTLAVSLIFVARIPAWWDLETKLSDEWSCRMDTLVATIAFALAYFVIWFFPWYYVQLVNSTPFD